MYLNTVNINGFPLVKRQNTQISSTLITESSIANLINKLIDTDGYVISTSLESLIFEFNLWGYYFKITSTSNQHAIDMIINDATFDTATEIYAKIQIVYPQNDKDFYYELSGIDEDSKYKGVNFIPDSNSRPETETANSITYHNKYLLILKRNDTSSDWYIPEESKLKINLVDGGEVI